MLKRASNDLPHRALSKAMMFGMAAAVLGASLACLALASPGFAQDGAKAAIPHLASSEFAWLAQGVRWLDPPPGLGRGPIRQGCIGAGPGSLLDSLIDRRCVFRRCGFAG